MTSNDLCAHVAAACDAIEARNGDLHILLEETFDRRRILLAAEQIDRNGRLAGVTVGIKDIIHADGHATRCGTFVPPELFAGDEASCVTALRGAGAIVMGKAVTTEFACLDPGPTRNPVAPDHTPGGSSSGSAAGVAAGFFDLALGTQTVGSVMRPAAYCGVMALKPTQGRIPVDGVVPFSPTVDQLGFFARDLDILARAASVLVADWARDEGTGAAATRGSYRIGVPSGPYLTQASDHGLNRFRETVERLSRAGFDLVDCATFEDIDAINSCHRLLTAAEMAVVHREWYRDHGDVYRAKTRAVIDSGLTVAAEELAELQRRRARHAADIASRLQEHGVDFWLAPGARGGADKGLDSTGDPVMNLPWTHAGLPVLSLPAGRDESGLPHGVQVVAAPGQDESLVSFGSTLAPALDQQNPST